MKDESTIINLDPHEWEEARKWADECGFSTPDDLVEHIVKEELMHHARKRNPSPAEADFVTRIRGETATLPVRLDPEAR